MMQVRDWVWGILACLVLGWALPAAAQESSPSAEEKAMMEKWALYSTPGEAHKHLSGLTGEWEYTMTWWMKPKAPPETSGGTGTAEMILGGRYLSDRYQGTAMGQPFEGHGLTGYDNFRKEYVSVWVDNMGTGVMVTRGKYDPQTKTLRMSGTFDDFMDGKSKTMRTVTTYVDKDTNRFEMYMPGPDGKEFKTMELVAKRRGVAKS
jgi:hypothetical protein